MNCINHNHPEYQSLLNLTGYNMLRLDLLINEFQSINNTLAFPTHEEIKIINDGILNRLDKVVEKLGIEYLEAEDLDRKDDYEKVIKESFEKRQKEGNWKVGEDGNIIPLAQVSKGSKSAPNKALNDKIKGFLGRLGIVYNSVNEIWVGGKKIEAIAVAKALHGIIEVVEGKADITTLPEEASHILVELLGDEHPLVVSMMSKIESYEIYKDVVKEYNELYEGDVNKLKKEAIGKVIAKIIVEKHLAGETEANNKKAQSWFSSLWNKILSIFKKSFLKSEDVKKVIEQYDPSFTTAADKILSSDTTDLKRGNASGEVFYQSDSDSINNALENKYDIKYNEDKINEKTKKKGVYLVKIGDVIKEVVNRVSDLVAAHNAKKGFAGRTAEQVKSDEIRSAYGTKGHADFNDIIKRHIDKLKGINTPRTISTNAQIYETLEKYFNEVFVKQFPLGSKFYTEKIIYDSKKNQAGTIDLLVVDPTGKVHIFDWKFIDFKGEEPFIKRYKEEDWNIQLSRYRSILRDNYGVKEFGKTRVIPVSAVYSKDEKLETVVIGTDKLTPVTIKGLVKGEVEKTGNEKIDRLIDILIENRKRVLKRKPKTDQEREFITVKVASIEKAISDLQINADANLFLKNAIAELTFYNQSNLNKLTLEQLLEGWELTNYYGKLLQDEFVDGTPEQLAEIKEQLAKIILNAQSLNVKLKGKIMNFLANDERIKDINVNETVTEMGFMQKWFAKLSTVDKPVVKALYRLISKQQEHVYDEHKEFNKKLEGKLKALKEWGSANGYSGTDIFNLMLRKDATTGKWNGRLVNMYNTKFYEQRAEAKSKKDSNWFRKNTKFNKDAYEKALKANEEFLRNYHTGENKDEKIQNGVEYFIEMYGPDSTRSMFNDNNRFWEAIDSWKSDEYKKIEANKAVHDFYMFFKDTIKDINKFVPVRLDGGFIPNVGNDIVSGVIQNGVGNISKIRDILRESFSANNDNDMTGVSVLSGEVEKTVPLYMTSEIDTNVKSKDLGSVLSLFVANSLLYKHMSDIESATVALRHVIQDQKQIVTDSFGNPVKDKSTGKVMEAIGNSNTLDQFNTFVDYYIYGIKDTSKDAVLLKNEETGKGISAKKVFGGASTYHSLRALSGNILSSVANLLGGTTMIFAEGVKDRLFSNKNYHSAMTSLTTCDRKAYALIEYFDTDVSNTFFKKAHKLSASGLSRTLTLDKLMALQRIGDFPVEKGVPLAMMKSHTLVNGKIVKITDDKQKSLYELSVYNQEKGEIEIKGMSPEEFHKFRRKIKYLIASIKGGRNDEDIRLANTNVYAKAIMMFRNWIPDMAAERFRKMTYIEDLEMYEKGKYRSFFNDVISKKIVGVLLTNLASAGVFGIGKGYTDAAIVKRAEQLYFEELKNNPNLKITKEEFIAIHKQNIKSTAFELQVIIAVTILMMLALKPGDDDDDETKARKAMLKKMGIRYMDELSFFMNPVSTTNIIQKPFPIMNLATDIEKFMRHTAGYIYGEVTDDKKMIKANHPRKYFNKTFPLGNAYESAKSLVGVKDTENDNNDGNN